MEAIAFVLGFVVVGALALRFGPNRRAGAWCQDQAVAAHGLTWAGSKPDRDAPAPTPPLGQPYPTLTFIERTLGTAAGTLTTAADAGRLEARARELTTEYWSDAVWTTGMVPDAAFRRVLTELAPALHETPLLALERPVAGAEPVALIHATVVPNTSVPAPARVWEASLELAGSIAPA